MAGLFALSVDKSIFRSQFSFGETLLFGGFYHQHLGEKRCGIAVCENTVIKYQREPGLIRPNFSQSINDFSEASEGIIYCGQSEEPFHMYSARGPAALCFSGNIINRDELIQEFFSYGRVFSARTEIEIIANLILHGKTWEEGILNAKNKIKGSFSLLILTKGGVYATTSPDCHWPLVIGKQEGAVAVACESSGFGNLGFKLERSLKPGEIVFLQNGKDESLGQSDASCLQLCKFLWVYTAFPTAKICGLPVSLVRKMMGANLARKDIEAGLIPDIVSFVPDSGRFHGLGYFEEFCRAVNDGLIEKVPFLDMPLSKYPHAGRSYTPSSKHDRDYEAHIKILASAERYDRKVLVLLDDSVVRGTQIKTNLVPKLRSMGFAKIHVRASNPELLSHCPWGKSTRPGEVLADRFPCLKERAEHLGVDSLVYNTLDDLRGVFRSLRLDPKSLCVDCAVKHS